MDFPVIVPPIFDQSAIAAFLDRETAKINALVEMQRRLIELLKEKRQAVISHAVTKGLDPSAPMKDSGVEWLGEVPAHWEVLPIKRRLALATSGPRGWSDFMSDEGALFFQSQNIGRRMEAIFTDASRVLAPDDSESVRAQLCEEDVVVCITGGRTAAVAHIRGLPEVAYINQHVCLLRAEGSALKGRYLAFLLASHEGQSQMDVASYGLKQGLGLTDLKNILIAAPPVREQQQIVDDLDAKLLTIESLAQQAEQAVSLLQERRAALISAAVTGKIDVRGLAANSRSDEIKAA